MNRIRFRFRHQLRHERRARKGTTVWRPALFVILFLAPGCDLPGKPKPDDRPIAADHVVNFEVLFRQNCAGCHGTDGKLGPAPPLNDATFLAIVPDSVLLDIIREGRSGTPMPAFTIENGGPLTDEQVKVLASGIKPKWGSVPPSDKQSIPPYSVPEGSPAGDRGRGAGVFGRACAPCHGANGEGTSGNDGGTGAVNDPAFLALISDQALRRLAITGRPDLGMPDYADKTARAHDYKPLTSADIVDLVAFLSSWRHQEQPARSLQGALDSWKTLTIKLPTRALIC